MVARLVLVGALAGLVPTAVSGQVDPPIIAITEVQLAKDKQLRARRVSEDLGELQSDPSAPYRIGPSDILAVLVWDHPELSGVPAVLAGGATDSGPLPVAPPGFVVDHAGMLHFPYAGLVPVAGLTQEQAALALAAALARYVRDPRVGLSVQSYRSQRIYIDGQVKNPGVQPINDLPMTLIEAVNRAGGFLADADQSRVVLERGASLHVLDLRHLVESDVNPTRIMLRHGDLVHVLAREENKVFVSGEVPTPRALPMHSGRMSLSEALGEAGGISAATGDSRQVYVVRRGMAGPTVYQLDARAPGAMAVAEEFELDPKDVVYVAPTSLANWHRAVSLIFPSELSSAVGAAKP